MTVMVANIGDFEYDEGKRLKEAGFAGIYHAVRMGEGRDTSIDPKTRLQTIQKNAKPQNFCAKEQRRSL